MIESYGIHPDFNSFNERFNTLFSESSNSDLDTGSTSEKLDEEVDQIDWKRELFNLFNNQSNKEVTHDDTTL